MIVSCFFIFRLNCLVSYEWNILLSHLLCFVLIDFFLLEVVTVFCCSRKTVINYFKLMRIGKTYSQNAFCGPPRSRQLDHDNRIFDVDVQNAGQHCLEVANTLGTHRNTARKIAIHGHDDIGTQRGGRLEEAAMTTQQLVDRLVTMVE